LVITRFHHGPILDAIWNPNQKSTYNVKLSFSLARPYFMQYFRPV
jgi:hypothetical protein